MQLAMCLACGEFVQVFPEGDTVRLSKETCPDCGGTRFKDTESGETIDATRR